jgi:hypothetical protein
LGAAATLAAQRRLKQASYSGIVAADRCLPPFGFAVTAKITVAAAAAGADLTISPFGKRLLRATTLGQFGVGST